MLHKKLEQTFSLVWDSELYVVASGVGSIIYSEEICRVYLIVNILQILNEVTQFPPPKQVQRF